MRKQCGCPSSVGAGADIGEYCDDCQQIVRAVPEPTTNREKLLEAERLVREVVSAQPYDWEHVVVTARLKYVAHSIYDLAQEVTG